MQLNSLKQWHQADCYNNLGPPWLWRQSVQHFGWCITLLSKTHIIYLRTRLENCSQKPSHLWFNVSTIPRVRGKGEKKEFNQDLSTGCWTCKPCQHCTIKPVSLVSGKGSNLPHNIQFYPKSSTRFHLRPWPSSQGKKKKKKKKNIYIYIYIYIYTHTHTHTHEI